MRITDRSLLVACTLLNLALFLSQILYIIPRTDHNSRLNTEQTERLRENQKIIAENRDFAQQTLEATERNHALHRQHQRDLEELAKRLPVWGVKP